MNPSADVATVSVKFSIFSELVSHHTTNHGQNGRGGDAHDGPHGKSGNGPSKRRGEDAENTAHDGIEDK